MARLAPKQHAFASGKRSRKQWALGILALAFGIAFVPEIIRVTLGRNFHVVMDGRLYRSAQPSGATLAGYVRNYGIHTVINLRGPNDGEEWFEEEKQAAQRSGTYLVSVNMSASDKPQEQFLRQLIDALDGCAEPILVHCYSGSDRSGFASACFLLMKTSATVDEAGSQLSLRYGHIPWGPAGCLTQVLGQYKKWLESQGLDHQSNHFRRWARAIYHKDDWPDQSQRK